jgi:insertion element IS1 protein InsB
MRLFPLAGTTSARIRPKQAIESNNARQRHWFARFRRRTCVVSRSAAMVDATMALYAHYRCNGGCLTLALVG